MHACAYVYMFVRMYVCVYICVHARTNYTVLVCPRVINSRTVEMLQSLMPLTHLPYLTTAAHSHRQTTCNVTTWTCYLKTGSQKYPLGQTPSVAPETQSFWGRSLSYPTNWTQISFPSVDGPGIFWCSCKIGQNRRPSLHLLGCTGVVWCGSCLVGSRG